MSDTVRAVTQAPREHRPTPWAVGEGEVGARSAWPLHLRSRVDFSERETDPGNYGCRGRRAPGAVVLSSSEKFATTFCVLSSLEVRVFDCFIPFNLIVQQFYPRLLVRHPFPQQRGCADGSPRDAQEINQPPRAK